MQHDKTRVIEITKHIKVTGQIDDALINHFKQMTQGDFYEWLRTGEATPNKHETPDHYENTELSLLGVSHTIKPVYNG